MILRSFTRKLWPVLIVAMAVAGFMVLRATGPSAPAPETSERIWQVRGMNVEPGTHQPSLELYGRTRSAQLAILRAATEGEIENVPVRAGERVEAGALLLRIDPAEARIALSQREADLSEAVAALESERIRAETDQRTLGRERELLQIAQRGLDRARDLKARNLGSDADLDAAQRTLEQARVAVDARDQAVADAPARRAQAQARQARVEATLERARLDLARTEVNARAASRVVEVHVSPGERVRVGDSLIRLYPLDDLEIHASLPERMVPRIQTLLQEGQPLTATAVVDGRPITAELARLAGETRSGEAGIQAVFQVRSDTHYLPLNRFVNLRLRLPEQEGSVAVPFEAFYGTDRVYRIVDQRLQGLQVERLGELQDDGDRTQALIRHPDLRAGDILVVTRLPHAVDGLAVEVTMATEVSTP
jgi:multidrug resistance efflux pump